ncbi:hypothetical protein [Burkholderia sp. L27(2015)]|uniref:hypothetical protein n=1 Tax=Burkholderia sp. L27(2015) TaxID=1641858 RepID=UPI00131E50D4|nr:hypothetical protein [Burkholderia sp. L27(2015)]
MDDNQPHQRQLARAQQREREEQRHLAHAGVAALLRDATRAPAVIAYALEQVAKWERGRLCSRDYIEQWHALLAGSPEAIADLLEARSPLAERLRQNTPFASYLRLPM